MLINLLRRFDSSTLRRLAGPTILKAIESVQTTHLEREIAAVLLQKYENAVLTVKEIRLGIIDSLDAAQAANFCSTLKLGGATHIEQTQALHKYFSSGFTEKKSKEFVDFFELDPKYYFRREQDYRTAVERIDFDQNVTTHPKPYLHPYQKRIKDAIIERLATRGHRFLVQMPTGSGKTYTALEAVVDVLRLPRQDRFVVWIVDSPELSEQALQSFERLWRLKGDRPIDCCRFFAGFEAPFSSMSGGMVFTSFDKFHSVISNRGHKAFADAWHLIRNTGLLIVDEAHTSVAPTHLECIRCFVNTDTSDVMGLTATPGRADPDSTEELVSLYSRNIVEITDDNGGHLPDPIRYLQENNYLAKVRTELLEAGTEVNEQNEDAILEVLAQNRDRNKKIIDQIELAAKAEESTLVFACNLDHVFALLILCRAKGIHAEFIVGQVSSAQRLKLLEDFKAKKFFILLNLELLSTGIDLPNLNKIIITRPVGSPILFSQILGRALRGPKNGGNPENTVINVQDNLRNYPSAGFLYRFFHEDWAVQN